MPHTGAPSASSSSSSASSAPPSSLSAKAQEQELKRARGAISCAECRRLKLKCDKKVPCSSCQRRGCASICPNGSLTTGQGTRFILADTDRLHHKISSMSDRIRLLEDALAILHSTVAKPGVGGTKDVHPLLTRELLDIKSGLALHSASNAPFMADALTIVGTAASIGAGVAGSSSSSGSGNGSRSSRGRLAARGGPTTIAEEDDDDEPGGEQAAYVDAFGTLALRDNGTATFYGRSAGTESLLLEEKYDVSPYPPLPAGNLLAPLPSEIQRLTSTFPSTPANIVLARPTRLRDKPAISGGTLDDANEDEEEDDDDDDEEENVLDLMICYLPPWPRAAQLCDLYLEQSQWFFGPVARRQLTEEVLPLFYPEAVQSNSSASSSILPTVSNSTTTTTTTTNLTSSTSAFDLPRKARYTAHDLALLFVIFCFGALTDPILPPAPYNLEAERYFQLTRAAINVDPVLDKPPSVVTVQTLSMMAIYQGLVADENSIESTWALMGLSTRLAQSVGLHRDCARWKLSPQEVQKRRALFWELFITDCWQSLATGRLPSLSLPFVDTELPGDPDETMAEDGSILPSFPLWKAKFGQSIVSSVVSYTLTASPPKYSIILDLDRKVRDFELPKYAMDFPGGGDGDEGGGRGMGGGRGQGGLNMMMRYYMPRNYREFIMLYIHRSYFALALTTSPLDPLLSPYAPSFLAGYRSACTLLTELGEQFGRFPKQIVRFWALWTHAFSAVVLVGSVVTHCAGAVVSGGVGGGGSGGSGSGGIGVGEDGEGGGGDGKKNGKTTVSSKKKHAERSKSRPRTGMEMEEEEEEEAEEGEGGGGEDPVLLARTRNHQGGGNKATTATVTAAGTTMKMAQAALGELKHAKELFEKAAAQGGRAVKFLPAVRRLYERAQQIYTLASTTSVSTSSSSSSRPYIPRKKDIFTPRTTKPGRGNGDVVDEEEEEDELAIFTGRKARTVTRTAPPVVPVPIAPAPAPAPSSSSGNANISIARVVAGSGLNGKRSTSRMRKVASSASLKNVETGSRVTVSSANTTPTLPSFSPTSTVLTAAMSASYSSSSSSSAFSSSSAISTPTTTTTTATHTTLTNADTATAMVVETYYEHDQVHPMLVDEMKTFEGSLDAQISSAEERERGGMDVVVHGSPPPPPTATSANKPNFESQSRSQMQTDETGMGVGLGMSAAMMVEGRENEVFGYSTASSSLQPLSSSVLPGSLHYPPAYPSTTPSPEAYHQQAYPYEPPYSFAYGAGFDPPGSSAGPGSGSGLTGGSISAAVEGFHQQQQQQPPPFAHSPLQQDVVVGVHVQAQYPEPPSHHLHVQLQPLPPPQQQPRQPRHHHHQYRHYQHHQHHHAPTDDAPPPLPPPPLPQNAVYVYHEPEPESPDPTMPSASHTTHTHTSQVNVSANVSVVVGSGPSHASHVNLEARDDGVQVGGGGGTSTVRTSSSSSSSVNEIRGKGGGAITWRGGGSGGGGVWGAPSFATLQHQHQQHCASSDNTVVPPVPVSVPISVVDPRSGGSVSSPSVGERNQGGQFGSSGQTSPQSAALHHQLQGRGTVSQVVSPFLNHAQGQVHPHRYQHQHHHHLPPPLPPPPPYSRRQEESSERRPTDDRGTSDAMGGKRQRASTITPSTFVPGSTASSSSSSSSVVTGVPPAVTRTVSTTALAGGVGDAARDTTVLMIRHHSLPMYGAIEGVAHVLPASTSNSIPVSVPMPTSVGTVRDSGFFEYSHSASAEYVGMETTSMQGLGSGEGMSPFAFGYHQNVQSRQDERQHQHGHHYYQQHHPPQHSSHGEMSSMTSSSFSSSSRTSPPSVGVERNGSLGGEGEGNDMQGVQSTSTATPTSSNSPASSTSPPPPPPSAISSSNHLSHSHSHPTQNSNPTMPLPPPGPPSSMSVWTASPDHGSVITRNGMGENESFVMYPLPIDQDPSHSQQQQPQVQMDVYPTQHQHQHRGLASNSGQHVGSMGYFQVHQHQQPRPMIQLVSPAHQHHQPSYPLPLAHPHAHPHTHPRSQPHLRMNPQPGPTTMISTPLSSTSMYDESYTVGGVAPPSPYSLSETWSTFMKETLPGPSLGVRGGGGGSGNGGSGGGGGGGGGGERVLVTGQAQRLPQMIQQQQQQMLVGVGPFGQQ